MTHIERRLIISQLKKAKDRHENNVHKALKAKNSGNNPLFETPEIDSLIELLGAGKV